MELGGRKSQSLKAVLPQDGLDLTRPLTQLHRKRRQPISIADTVSVENLVGDLVPRRGIETLYVDVSKYLR